MKRGECQVVGVFCTGRGTLRGYDILAEGSSQACKGIEARHIWEERTGISEGSPTEPGQVGAQRRRSKQQQRGWEVRPGQIMQELSRLEEIRQMAQ